MNTVHEVKVGGVLAGKYRGEAILGRGGNADSTLDPASGTLTAFGEGAFVALNASLPASPAAAVFPALSGDGLAFYYRESSSDPTLHGIYESVRASTGAICRNIPIAPI